MSTVLTIAVAPFVLFLTVPLVISATITSFFAFVTLAIRLALVYIEFAVSILRQQLSASLQLRKRKVEYTNWVQSNPYEWDIHNTPSGLPPSTRVLPRRAPSFQYVNTTTTGGSSGDMTPMARDFEGLGGWRFLGSDDEDDDALWTSMNARLELPAILAMADEQQRRRPHQHHRNRSAISLSALEYERRQRPSLSTTKSMRPASAIVSGAASPEEVFGGEPRAFARSRPVSNVVSGSASPEDEFGERRGSKGAVVTEAQS